MQIVMHCVDTFPKVGYGGLGVWEEVTPHNPPCHMVGRGAVNTRHGTIYILYIHIYYIYTYIYTYVYTHIHELYVICVCVCLCAWHSLFLACYVMLWQKYLRLGYVFSCFRCMIQFVCSDLCALRLITRLRSQKLKTVQDSASCTFGVPIFCLTGYPKFGS